MSEKKRCMCCMEPVPEDAASCPHCGYNGSQQNADGALPIGTRLNKGRFLVGRIDAVQADCVEYAGSAVKGMARCVIMEYLPAGGAVRAPGELLLQAAQDATKKYKDGLAKFIQFYGKFDNAPEGAAIPHFIDSFVQNGTGYVVFSKFEGMTLRELLKFNGGVLSAEQAQIVLAPVLKGLEFLQDQGVIHGSISPDNILINRNGDVCLSGFSTDPYAPSNGMNGYVSPEAENGRKLTLASDVYSMGAVFYRAMVGTVPQDARQRANYDTLATPKELNDTIPWEVSNAVWHAMLVDPEKRIGTIAEFSDALKGDGDVFEGADEQSYTDRYVSSSDNTTEISLEEDIEEKKKSLWSMLAILAVSLFVVMIFVYIIGGVISGIEQRRREKQAEEERNSITGIVTVPAPDYIGKMVEDVEYDTVQFDYVLVGSYDPSKRTGLIVGQDPQPGTGLMPDDRVILLYVNRDTPKTVILPDFDGLYYMNAKVLAESLGLQVEFRYEITSDVQHDLVFRQNAEPGIEFLTSNTLKLTVAQAPEPEPEPDPAPEPEPEQDDSDEDE